MADPCVQIRKPAIVARLFADGVGLGDEIDVRLTEVNPEKTDGRVRAGAVDLA